MRRNYCRSILLLWYPSSHSLWINLWTCMVSELSCHLWEATIVWTPALSVVYICVCWPPKRRVHTITSLLLQHRKYLLLLCCLPYLPSQGVTLISIIGSHAKASSTEAGCFLLKCVVMWICLVRTDSAYSLFKGQKMECYFLLEPRRMLDSSSVQEPHRREIQWLGSKVNPNTCRGTALSEHNNKITTP